MEHARPPAELLLGGGPAARAESWRKWRKQFEVFLKASGVSKESGDVQASLLVNLIGPAGYEVYSTFTFTEKEKEDVESLIKKFDEHFGTKPNVTVSRYKFFIRNQEEGENIDEWVTSLRLLSQSCEFGSLQDSLIRDRIVCGIVNNTVRDRLLRKDGLTLAKAIEICHAAEISQEESRCIEGGPSEIRVDAVWGLGGRGGRAGAGAAGWRGRGSDRRVGRRGARAPGGAARPGPSRQLCAACGSSGCAGGQRCSAYGVLCYLCDKKGHFARVCTQKKNLRDQVCDVAVEESDCDSSEDASTTMYYCLDPRPLNRAVRRAHYSLPTVSELAVRLQGARYFSVLDARAGFWMVQMDDASADLCTFGTPFGRYQFLRLPYGINCAPEVFQPKLRQHLEDLEGVDSFIDDVIVWGSTKQEHDARLKCLLDRSKEIGIKYNKEKCKFGVREIVYLGHKFDENGMRPDESKVRAIMEMPYPSDRKALERFLGMVNYLAKFIQNYSDSVAILRGLLKKETEWVWDQQHSAAVDELKRKIASAPVLAIYSTAVPVLLSVDASAAALGAVLLQGGRPVEFASLTLTDTQTRYAQIEKEMLAIIFAVERFKQYIYGRSDVTVQTDHKPLEPLFNKPLASVPARLQRMMMRVQGFDIRVEYTPGKYMYIADTLSRAPLAEKMHNRVSDEVARQTCFLINNVQVSDKKLDLIRLHIAGDEESKTIINYIRNGWPKNRWEVSECVRVLWPYRETLQFIDGLIFKDSRVYIPQSIRGVMLDKIHEGHLGIDRCKRRAREVMFWPGMSAAVERRARECPACALHAPAPRREPLLPHAVPDLPWRKLASDIFEYRKTYYIVLVDYFSNYVEVGQLKNITSKSVVSFMKDQFSRHGIPNELVTDNGPAYSSTEFKKFMMDWQIDHVTSMPRYAQGNGKSERTVQTVKNIIKKCQDSGADFYLSLLNYRATPRHGIDSPAQILMGRRLNTKLPVKQDLLYETVDNKQNYQRLMQQREKNKKYFDRSAKKLSTLVPGQKTVLIDGGKRKPVTVVTRALEPRSFVVVDRQGRKYRRNRRHLVARGAAGQAQAPPTDTQPEQSTLHLGQTTHSGTGAVHASTTECAQPIISAPLTRSKARKTWEKVNEYF